MKRMSFWKKMELAGVLVFLLAGCAANAGTEPNSAKATSTTGDYLSGTYINGEWSLVFKSNGTFTSEGPEGKQKYQYRLNGDQMVITSKNCGKAEGIYQSHNDMTILTLKAVDDTCTERVGILTSAMWYYRP